MDTKILMTVEEYLRSPFDGPDRDYVDGEVIERNMGELPHSRVQTELILKLSGLARTLGLQVFAELRVQVSATRFRVADIAVWRSGPIGQRIPTVPPFLVVEILSPEDRIVRLSPKIQEYLSHGVEWVWVVDPDERRALSYSAARPGGVLVDVLRAENPEIALPLADVLAVLDR
jgi:Uma2 family endonuclease